MKPTRPHKGPVGPTQRQLRAGELVRHALVEVLREEEFDEPVLYGTPVTITQARISPDLKHAIIFVEPLGGGRAAEVVKALNKHSKFLRGRLGHHIDLKFTPDLKFVHDESFDEAARIARLFDDPRVRADLATPPSSDVDGDED